MGYHDMSNIYIEEVIVDKVTKTLRPPVKWIRAADNIYRISGYGARRFEVGEMMYNFYSSEYTEDELRAISERFEDFVRKNFKYATKPKVDLMMASVVEDLTKVHIKPKFYIYSVWGETMYAYSEGVKSK
jgi:hypothetical protein